MRTISPEMQAIWESGDYVGENRPMARVTIQKLNVALERVSPEKLWASVIFNQNDIPRELPNVKSVSWERGIDSDVATCKVQLYNTKPLPLGETPNVETGDFDQPGYYTFNRGKTDWSATRWGHVPNEWQDMLVPDRLIRTYEGYGFDRTVIPELDPHLMQTGLWMIDEVDYTHNGLITLTCRDVGRMLLDHIMFPPVIPLAAYPLEFEKYHQVDNPDIVTTTGGAEFRPTFSGSSNTPYVSSPNDALYGHKPSDAFDGNESTWWLSVGNSLPSAPYSFEWVQGSFTSRKITMVRAKMWGGPYRCYVSVLSNGVWQGAAMIPYDPNNPASAPNGANIHYVQAKTASRDDWVTFNLGAGYDNCTAVRVTMTNLFNSGLGRYPYRAGVRELRASSTATVTTDGGTHTEGNYGDYTEVVKILLAYGGFHWPSNATTAFVRRSDGEKVSLPATTSDPYLEHGRVWGDMLMSGTAGQATLTVDIWDKKPLMDGINYIKEILGFIFYIDESGAAIFRLPNIFTLGNVYTSESVLRESASERLNRIATEVFTGQRTFDDVRREVDALAGRPAQVYPNPYPGDSAYLDTLNHTEERVQAIFDNRGVPLDSTNNGWTDAYVTIDEKQTLIGLTTKLSSRSVRENVFIANTDGRIGATSQGWNEYPSGLRRVGGWTDQHFDKTSECQVMADMITLRQLFEYRTDSVQIAANPAIQIDDQVKIFERTTNEGYFHYVKSISSSNDLEKGSWTYDLSTHWLGEAPFDKWAFDPRTLAAATKTYLAALGKM